MFDLGDTKLWGNRRVDNVQFTVRVCHTPLLHYAQKQISLEPALPTLFVDADLLRRGSLICATTNTGGLHQLGSGTASCAQTHLLADSHREPDLTSYESHTYTVIFTNIDSAVAAALATTPQPVPTPVPYQVKPTIASISLPGTGEISTTSTATASASSDSFQHPLSSSSSTKIGAGVGVSLGVLALGVVGLLAFRRRMSKRKKPKGPSELYFNDAGTRQVEAAGIEGGEITKGSK